jgi:hypothetical protein
MPEQSHDRRFPPPWSGICLDNTATIAMLPEAQQLTRGIRARRGSTGSLERRRGMRVGWIEHRQRALIVARRLAFFALMVVAAGDWSGDLRRR